MDLVLPASSAKSPVRDSVAIDCEPRESFMELTTDTSVEDVQQMSLSMEEPYDLVCIGFGPASLAIAVALHDQLEEKTQSADGLTSEPRILYLEKQAEFGWHKGMLLPGSKMQISFLKDLATLRNPRSKFTFINYLKEKKRLVQFSNLGTFLPSRLEFEDYLRWCAGQFSSVVKYGHVVNKVSPAKSANGQVSMFEISSQNITAWEANPTIKARHVVIGIGGKPAVPALFLKDSPRVVHSSQYCSQLPSQLSNKSRSYHIAVVGGGQSAAEIFNDLHSRFPNAQTTMIVRDTALRPSDDSPFVNEIFDPEHVDRFYDVDDEHRIQTLKADKATNYSVVRLELLEHIYQTFYEQRIETVNEKDWPHKILFSTEVTEATLLGDNEGLRLSLTSTSGQHTGTLEVDAVITATGYQRDAHEDMLTEIQPLNASKDGQWNVARNYKVKLDDTVCSSNCGIWLQGCNEQTHGLSDTLLSILAVRGGEMVDSIFGDRFR